MANYHIESQEASYIHLKEPNPIKFRANELWAQISISAAIKHFSTAFESRNFRAVGLKLPSGSPGASSASGTEYRLRLVPADETNSAHREKIEQITREVMKERIQAAQPKEKKLSEPDLTKALNAYWERNGAQRSDHKKTFFIALGGIEQEHWIGRITLSYFSRHRRWQEGENGFDPKFTSMLRNYVCIDNLHIKQEYQRHGIGLRLIRFTNNIFRKNLHCPGTFLKIIEGNDDAIRLASRIGFREVGFYGLQRGSKDQNTYNRRFLIWRPSPVYTPERAFYLNKFNGILEKLRDNLIIFVLFFLLFQAMSLYVDINSTNQLKLELVKTYQLETFLAAGLLTLLAIAFSLYDVTAGLFYVQFRPSEREITSWNVDQAPRFWPIILLITFELLMIITNNLIIIGPVLILKSDFAVPGYYLFWLLASWHFWNFCWYASSPVLVRKNIVLSKEEINAHQQETGQVFPYRKFVENKPGEYVERSINEKDLPKISLRDPEASERIPGKDNRSIDRWRRRDFIRHLSYVALYAGIIFLFEQTYLPLHIELVSFVENELNCLICNGGQIHNRNFAELFAREMLTVLILAAVLLILYQVQLLRFFRNDFQRISVGYAKRSARTEERANRQQANVSEVQLP